LKKYSEKEEREIIAGCAIESEKYQELQYKWYYGYVMAVSLSYCANRDVAQEITHDSFMKIFSSINKFDEKQILKSWIRKIAVNMAIDYYRNLSSINNI
jgi:RNA polymerase sigma-70 factor (ECF subfamily)|tara:strand:- start:282 stop:578 length:297 start_codon:yes stop_codon:yes gene_type:complete